MWEHDNSRQWYRFEWDLSDTNAQVVIPDSVNKIFVGVDGTLLLCDDGTAFDTKEYKWVTLPNK